MVEGQCVYSGRPGTAWTTPAGRHENGHKTHPSGSVDSHLKYSSYGQQWSGSYAGYCN